MYHEKCMSYKLYNSKCITNNISWYIIYTQFSNPISRNTSVEKHCKTGLNHSQLYVSLSKCSKTLFCRENCFNVARDFVFFCFNPSKCSSAWNLIQIKITEEKCGKRRRKKVSTTIFFCVFVRFPAFACRYLSLTWAWFFYIHLRWMFYAFFLSLSFFDDFIFLLK